MKVTSTLAQPQSWQQRSPMARSITWMRPIERLGAMDVPIPFTPALENRHHPRRGQDHRRSPPGSGGQERRMMANRDRHAPHGADDGRRHRGRLAEAVGRTGAGRRAAGRDRDR